MPPCPRVISSTGGSEGEGGELAHHEIDSLLPARLGVWRLWALRGCRLPPPHPTPRRSRALQVSDGAPCAGRRARGKPGRWGTGRCRHSAAGSAWDHMQSFFMCYQVTCLRPARHFIDFSSSFAVQLAESREPRTRGFRSHRPSDEVLHDGDRGRTEARPAHWMSCTALKTA